MSLFLIFKGIIVVLFLVMFLRSSKLVWGIGLTTVTSAILLDTILSTFTREEVLEQLGFFYFVIGGMLFAGAALWFWMLLGPYVKLGASTRRDALLSPIVSAEEPRSTPNPSKGQNRNDRLDQLNRLLQEDFDHEDFADLMFDLGYDASSLPSNPDARREMLSKLITVTEEGEESDRLRLAVDRIRSPAAAADLPRAEKLAVESPPTVLRQYLLAHFTPVQLDELAAQVQSNWQRADGESHRAAVRNLLLDLYRNERLDLLIGQLRSGPGDLPK